jgi:hypothetical protein
MNEERLESLLASLRHERMDRIADERIRARLETAWTTRQQQRSFGFRFRRLAPVLAAGVLLLGLGTATMSAPGESPLYGVRVAIEDASIALHADPEDRAAYVLALLDDRQAEASRLEAAGNAAAASRARAIEANTVRIVRAMLPQTPELPAPAPAASSSASPARTPDVATPTPAPTATPMAPASTTSVTPSTPRPTVAPTQAPAPTATPTKTPTPTMTPTGSPFLVTIYGLVKNSDATPASAVCVRTTTTTPDCYVLTAPDGTYRFAMSARLNQTITVVLTRQDGTVLWKGTATITVKGATVQVPDVKLAK